MEKYNYRNAVREDVLEYLRTEIDSNELTLDNISNLYDVLMFADSVTGNASGSYTFCTWEAEEHLCHNFDLIEEVAENMGIEPKITPSYEDGAEIWDVRIRCYLLYDVLSEVLEELEEEREA